MLVAMTAAEVAAVTEDGCPPGGCEFSLTTVLPTTTTTITITPADGFLLPLLDDIEEALKGPLRPCCPAQPSRSVVA